MKLFLFQNLGMSLPDLEVIDILGNKSSDQTFLARSRSNCSMFAIKSMTKQNASSPNLLKHVRSEQTCLRMITEGDLPFLPKLHRSFQDDTRLYMIMASFHIGILADLFITLCNRICILVEALRLIYLMKAHSHQTSRDFMQARS